jgi:hypothetical protein
MRLLGEPRTWLLAACVFLVFACSGGGCSSCEGCGVRPIRGGFPIDDRIPNSAQMRLTDNGIAFIEDNIGAIIANFLEDGLDFDITNAGSGVCESDTPRCFAHGEINDLDITPMPPNRLNAHLRVVLDSRNASGGRAPIPVEVDAGLFTIDCDIDLDTRRGSRPYVGLVANIDMVEESQAARRGYTKIDVSSADLAEGESIENDDIDIDGGFIGVCNIADLFKGILIGELTGQLTGTLQSALDDQLCTTQGMYGCPTGTVADGAGEDAVCRFTAGGECVPLLLGTDGEGDLGDAFLGGTSPGTHSPGQFLLAAGGQGEAINDGVSLFFYGGFRSTDQTFAISPAHNSCVPLIEPPPIPTIPRAEMLRGNTIPGGGTSHVGIGLSEQFLNYSGYGMFDSGMLCLGVGTRLSQQLSSGLFSLIGVDLASLTFPDGSQPLSLALRPQEPPQFEVGTAAGSPLLTVVLPNLAIDFYVWSSERYVRFMTYQATLRLPISLTVADGALAPTVGDVTAIDSTVTNNDLLAADPTTVASMIEILIGTFAGMLAGSIDPIELPSIMGFDLTVPENGVQGFTDSGEDFVGIFANLAVAAPSMIVRSADTHAELVELAYDPAVLALETFGRGELPEATVRVRAEGADDAEYEYSYRIDGMQWSEWEAADTTLRIQSRTLLLQAKHELEVRARLAGHGDSSDPTPARLELLVDAVAPSVELDRQADGVHIRANDWVSPPEALKVRVRSSGGAWSELVPLSERGIVPVSFDDEEVEVEVTDEAGNIGSAKSALIRGIPNPLRMSDCDCRVPGRSDSSIAPLALIAGGLGWLVWRRRGGRR